MSKHNIMIRFVKAMRNGWFRICWSAMPFLLAGITYAILGDAHKLTVGRVFFYLLTVTLIGDVVNGVYTRYYSISGVFAFRGKNPKMYWFLIITSSIFALLALVASIGFTVLPA